MTEQASTDAQSRLDQAFQYMNAALEILDETDTPAQIGSHLDLAIRRLEELLWPDRPQNEVLALLGELELAIPSTARDPF